MRKFEPNSQQKSEPNSQQEFEQNSAQKSGPSLPRKWSGKQRKLRKPDTATESTNAGSNRTVTNREAGAGAEAERGAGEEVIGTEKACTVGTTAEESVGAEAAVKAAAPDR